MTMELNGKRVVVGVTGGIAAYKAAELVRLLMRQGADVQVAIKPSRNSYQVCFHELTFRTNNIRLCKEINRKGKILQSQLTFFLCYFIMIIEMTDFA